MSTSALWGAVIIASLTSFALKWLGYQIPMSLLERPLIARMSALMPIALLAALAATQTFTAGTALVLDARIVGVLTAGILLWRRAPFLAVILAGAAATAITRLLGWG